MGNAVLPGVVKEGGKAIQEHCTVLMDVILEGSWDLFQLRQGLQDRGRLGSSFKENKSF